MPAHTIKFPCPWETHKLTERRPVMTVTSYAGDKDAYYSHCSRQPCAWALAKLVKSSYSLMERSPLETICQGPSPTSHCISIQQTTQGRASDSRNNINNHSTRQNLLYACKIMQIFVLFWKCLCICSFLYSFTILDCMMLVTLISWTNTLTFRIVCGGALLWMSFTVSLCVSLSLYRNKDTALMFSFWMGIDSK